ncbi:MAG: VWA domain-containing protein [Lachnospiraceae bacterium]|nr:VWA domain-containing protein [Lachnospiraceae bacterium]
MRFEPVFPIALMIPVMIVVFFALSLNGIRRGSSLIRKTASVIISLLLVADTGFMLARPMVKNNEVEYTRPNLDVLFVVDNTISMWAKDCRAGTRMKEAEDTIDRIMETLKGSSFALITFGSESEIRMPLTQDAQSISDAVTTLRNPSKYVAKGSSLNAPYEDMKYMLEHMGKDEERQRIVFFISDGEITNGDKLMDFSPLKKMTDGGAVLGFGSEKGANMKDVDGYNIYDYDKNMDAVSRIDKDNLKSIADDLDIAFIHVEWPEDADIVTVAALEKARQVMEDRGGMDAWDDIYYRFIPLFIILLFAEALIYRE